MLTNFEYNGQVISKREDGYINLSSMCRANDRKINDFARLKATRLYTEELSALTGIPASEILNIQHGKEVWGHPSLAIRLAQWISPKFAVWCDAHIFNLMCTGSTSLDIDPIDKMIELEKLRNSTAIAGKESRELDIAMLTLYGKEVLTSPCLKKSMDSVP